MKKGLLVYKNNSISNIFNIGDYIQSLAALQFFNNKVDYYINRENLNTFDGDDVKLIMNGWFMHEPQNWPPIDRIKPLFVSFHLNSSAYTILDNDNSIQYFKEHEPIGCRDKKTVEILSNKGIKAYFTGCLTLTLGRTYFHNNKSKAKIYFTDVYVPYDISVLQKLLYIVYSVFAVKNIIVIMRKKFRRHSIRNFIKTAIFYSIYKKIFSSDILVCAEYINHELEDIFYNDDEKFSYAECLLHKYADAIFVVTSKIHCALPCLSLQTPVLFVDNEKDIEESKCRLDGIKQLFHIILWNGKQMKCELCSSIIDKNFSFCNKRDYEILKDNLINICEEFSMQNE